MKAVSQILIFSLLLVALGCGKENESGKSGGICLQYGMNGQCSQYSAYSNYGLSGNVNLNGILSQIPCEQQMFNGNTWQMPQMNMGMGRIQLAGTVQLSQNTTPGQSYIGITSTGDIAILQGNGQRSVQATFFLCQNGSISTGGHINVPNPNMVGRLNTIGEFSTSCGTMKVITSLSTDSLHNFRSPQFGLGMPGYGQGVRPFPGCGY